MISFEESVRLVRIQERLRNATYHELRKEGGGKSSEGAVSITFQLPPVVGDEAEPYWVVEAYSYLLNTDGRTQTWTGKNASEAISKAEDEVRSWCMMPEMEMLSERTGFTDDPRDDGEEYEPPFGAA